MREDDVPPALRITIGEPTRIEHSANASRLHSRAFDEWRGGSGLSLPNARRIIEAHGGRLWSAAEDGKASAIVVLPRPVSGA